MPDPDSDIMQLARDLCPATVNAVQRINGGGNNLLYRVDTGDLQYALKVYLLPSNDERDRLQQEFAAYRFLHDNNVTEMPAPVTSDPSRGAAVYTWIDGTSASTPDGTDIDRAVTFLEKLHTLRHAPGAEALSHAAEASLSPAQLLSQITPRRERLAEPAVTMPELMKFLEQDFDPALHRFRDQALRAYETRGWSWDEDITPAQRTLSPSDFGFHNALRVNGDSLVFFDFEYFGWDDPVRAVADFLLHPGHVLDQDARQRFCTAMTAVYGAADPGFAERLNILYPMVALRWAMIALGDFLPQRMARRLHLESSADTAQILDRQLGKARTFVAELNNVDGAWPYGD